MEKVRPTLLTVLCILTFIGSGFSIYSGIQSYLTADVTAGATSEAMEELQDQMEDQEVPGFMGELFNSIGETMTPDKVKNMGIATLISSILTLIGAVFMWGLRKNGFYLYVIGTIIAIVAPMLIYNGMMGNFSAAGNTFIGILFSVLYGLNLKYMS